MPIDFVHDENPDVFLYLRNEGMMPEYVSNSDVFRPGDCDSLADVAFADQDNRLFPCHTKAACWESAAYFAGRGLEDDKIKAQIEKMASVHNITEDVQAVFNKFEEEYTKAAATEVVEAPEEKFALILDWDGVNSNGVQAFYPVTTHDDCVESSEKAASAYQAGSLPLPVFYQVASNIVKAASADALDELAPVVRRFGTDRLPDPYGAEILLGMRKEAGVNVAPYVAIAKELQRVVRAAESVDMAKQAASNAARLIFHLDQQNGIQYNSSMKDPYSVIFSGPLAADMEKFAASTVDILGIDVPVTDFLNLSDNRIDSSFSKNVASVVKEAKACLEGELAAEKTAAAAEKLRTLDEAARKMVLVVAADTGW